MSERKTAVVAGGSAGIGRATVEALLAEGYDVGVLARGKARLTDLEYRHPRRVLGIACDVADAEAVQTAARTVEERFGPIRVWVNAAMLTSFSPFAQMQPDEFVCIVHGTFIGVVNGTRAALAVMEPRGEGRIVNVGSGLAYRAVPFQSAYCASKHAINGFSDAVRAELMRDGSKISLGVVQLPAVNTPQFDWARNRLPKKPQPAPPIYQPELAARAVMRAVREGSREILVGKSLLQLVFGHMVAPGYLDRVQQSEMDDPGDRADNLYEPAGNGAIGVHGSYGDRAADKGLIVDGGRARLAIFAGVPLVRLLAGLALG
jgi:NAD(P)-dependent dehydrogenase (short-subunit alcohol dehydrogenase family)